jgi:CheY-like chemotaxis protein/nitrogen-specific signal transduction histidine kinase
VRLVGAVQDITGQKRTEEALHDADQRKNEFLAMLSHELRNPLAPIRNAVHILDKAAPGGAQARRAQRIIDRQVTHLARLIEDLLDVTRISRGKIELRCERLELNGLIRRTAEDHRSELAQGEIDFALEVTDVPLYVNGDPTRLAQVVGNLLQNAAKFTPAGGRVKLSLDAADGEAVIRLEDTGRGISADTLAHLFEPFVQGEKGLDRSRGGLGLGLALVKGLTELHHGKVSVHSDGVGRGAQFVVKLPLDRAAAAPQEEAEQPAAAKRCSLKVLVIEDNVDAAESLKEVLELDAHVVEVAHEGREGIEKARRFHPDVILCDIGLPQMDGYQVARELRTDASLSSTYVVALSGYAQPEDVERSRLAGFDEHLVKPPDLGALDRMLRELPHTARL